MNWFSFFRRKTLSEDFFLKNVFLGMLILFSLTFFLSCDRETQLRLNLSGERELFIELCCSCLARTSIPDAGVAENTDADAGPILISTCLLNQPAEICVAALSSGGTFDLQGACVLDEKSPCDPYCRGVLGYLPDDSSQ